jgi:hypothetical protein
MAQDDKSCEVTKVLLDSLDKQWLIRLDGLDKQWLIRHKASEDLFYSKIDALKESIKKSEELNDAKHTELNNFRQQNLDERHAYATRREIVYLTGIITLLIVVTGALIKTC